MTQNEVRDGKILFVSALVGLEACLLTPAASVTALQESDRVVRQVDHGSASVRYRATTRMFGSNSS